MIITPSEITLVGSIMFFGSLVQGAVGFGSGLLGVPLLVICGFSIPEAATINLVSSGAQNATGAWKLWSHLDPMELVVPVTVRLLAIPFGAYLAYVADLHFDPAQAKQLIGAILITLVCLLWGLRVVPRDILPIHWQLAAFSSSGILLGFATIGGAPMVLYVNAVSWSANKSRAFLFFCSAVAMPVAAISYWIEHGEKIFPAAATALLVMPVVLAGLWLGLHLGHRLSKILFRRITYALILLVAIAAIVGPAFG